MLYNGIKSTHCLSDPQGRRTVPVEAKGSCTPFARVTCPPFARVPCTPFARVPLRETRAGPKPTMRNTMVHMLSPRTVSPTPKGGGQCGWKPKAPAPLSPVSPCGRHGRDPRLLHPFRPCPLAGDTGGTQRLLHPFRPCHLHPFRPCPLAGDTGGTQR